METYSNLYLSRDVGHGHSLGTDARTLHNQLLVAQLRRQCDWKVVLQQKLHLHAIEPRDGLVSDTSIQILGKCITLSFKCKFSDTSANKNLSNCLVKICLLNLGETRSDVLDKVECLQLAKRGEQLFHLKLSESKLGES